MEESGTGVEGVGNPGVFGYSHWGTAGVQGHGYYGTGVHGESWNTIGVAGIAHGDRSIGVYGSATGQGAYGGVFVGGLVNMGGPKAAAVPHRDGSMRLLYSMESPESWFEDFGRARLARGRARVKLDRNFVAVIRADDYHIFLMPEGDSKGLYVSRRMRAGFEVREQQGGASSLTFSYRVVARRKDVEAPRFKKFTARVLKVKGRRRPEGEVPERLRSALQIARRPLPGRSPASRAPVPRRPRRPGR